MAGTTASTEPMTRLLGLDEDETVLGNDGLGSCAVGCLVTEMEPEGLPDWSLHLRHAVSGAVSVRGVCSRGKGRALEGEFVLRLRSEVIQPARADR